MAWKVPDEETLYSILKSQRCDYHPDRIGNLLAAVDSTRVQALCDELATYIAKNLPKSIDRRSGLADYRTNPYVLLTTASIMKLKEPRRFADFLFNNKLYMGLETSFGKSIESVTVGQYPIGTQPAQRWQDPPEKGAEHKALSGLTNEKRARARTNSIWREIDKSCVIGTRRYLTSIKSGPNCINDTQVEAMKSAIVQKHELWLGESRKTYPRVSKMDIVIGLTYGTDRTTNNKENQILVKLLEHGFIEDDRQARPGVLIDAKTGTIRVYRRIGRDFWAFIGAPHNPESADGVFLEVVIALARALAKGMSLADLETRVNRKIEELATAFSTLRFPQGSLPQWMRRDFSEDELFWLATAVTAFYDQGV